MTFNVALSNFQYMKTRYTFIKDLGNAKEQAELPRFPQVADKAIISQRNSLLEEHESKILPSSQTQFKYFRKLSNGPIFHPARIPATLDLSPHVLSQTFVFTTVYSESCQLA
jgi:hypothetical protein